MSDSSINFSSRGAFSYNWNKGIDSNNYFLIRLGKSLLGFFKGLFCGYTVSKVEIDKFLENRDHRNSIFSKECKKKLDRFNVNPNYESVNGGGDKAELDEGVEILYGHQMRDKVYKIELDNDVSSSRESIDGDTLEGEGMDVDTLEGEGMDVDTLEGEDSMSNASEVEELKSLMNVENFSVDNDRFSIDNLRSLKADDCFYLFNHALNKNHSEIALRLLLTGNCNGFQYFTLEKKANILHFFMGLGLVSEVKALLENDIVDVNVPDDNGRTLLMIAAQRGQEKLLTAVMVNADVNALDCHGFTPLHYAAVSGQEESLKLLLAAGANPNCISSLCSTTPLHNAIMRDHIECVKVLLDRTHIEVNGLSKVGMTPLSQAFLNGNEACVKLLLRHPSIDVNKMNAQHLTPLGHVLSIYSPLFLSPKLAKSSHLRPFSRPCLYHILRAKGIVIDYKDSLSNTLLYYVAGMADEVFYKQLLDEKVICDNINDKNNAGYTALHLAAARDCITLIKALVKIDTLDANETDKNGRTALHLAAINGNIESINALLTVRGVNVDLKDNDGNRPLDLLPKGGSDYEKCKNTLESYKQGQGQGQE